MRGGRGIKGGFSCDDTNVSSIVRTANSKAAGQLAGRRRERGREERMEGNWNESSFQRFFSRKLMARLEYVERCIRPLTFILHRFKPRYTFFFSPFPPSPSHFPDRERYRVANYKRLPISFPSRFSRIFLRWFLSFIYFLRIFLFIN